MIKTLSEFLNFNLKGTVMQIEKALINDPLQLQKYPENFALQLFKVLQ